MKQREPNVVVVTGAAGGIGYAIAEAFAREGDIPVLADLNETVAASAAERLKSAFGVDAAACRLDVTDAESVRGLIESVIERWGRLDVVVNNAGLQYVSPVEQFPIEQWDLLIDVMLKGPFLMTKYAVPHMRSRRYGRIINIASVHGRLASPYKSAYIAAKHGVVGLTRTVALETAEDGITVNAVMPGVVRTPLIENQLEHLAAQDGIGREEALHKHFLAKQALKRFILPEEVAAVCVFLASPGASSITGDTISVSGGW